MFLSLVDILAIQVYSSCHAPLGPSTRDFDPLPLDERVVVYISFCRLDFDGVEHPLRIRQSHPTRGRRNIQDFGQSSASGVRFSHSPLSKRGCRSIAISGLLRLRCHRRYLRSVQHLVGDRHSRPSVDKSSATQGVRGSSRPEFPTVS